MTQPRKVRSLTRLMQHQFHAIAVHDVSGMDHGTQHEPFGVHQQMAACVLLTFLPPSKPRCPPTPLVFTDWLSMLTESVSEIGDLSVEARSIAPVCPSAIHRVRSLGETGLVPTHTTAQADSV